MIFKSEKTEWLILRAERYMRDYRYVYLVHLTDDFLARIRTYNNYICSIPDASEDMRFSLSSFNFTLVCVEDCEIPELKDCFLDEEINSSFIELTDEELDLLTEVSLDYYADDYFYLQKGHLFALMYHLVDDEDAFKRYESKPFPIEKIL